MSYFLFQTDECKHGKYFQIHPQALLSAFASQQEIVDSLGNKQMSRCAECCHADCELIKVSFYSLSAHLFQMLQKKVQHTLEKVVTRRTLFYVSHLKQCSSLFLFFRLRSLMLCNVQLLFHDTGVKYKQSIPFHATVRHQP